MFNLLVQSTVSTLTIFTTATNDFLKLGNNAHTVRTKVFLDDFYVFAVFSHDRRP